MHYRYAAIKADNSVTQLFSEHDGTEAHLTSLLSSAETLVAVSALPDSGPYIYDPATETVAQDTAAAAAAAAKARLDALEGLYQRQLQLQAMASAGEDVADRLAEAAAAISAA